MAARATVDVRDKIGGALWGLFIGDALASPSHWFYGGSRQVTSTYGGPIRGYVKPSQELSGSIMNLSSTGGGGRGSDGGDIIGTVINHGKKKYWTRQGSYHYHCTLQAGENTLEASLTRLVVRSITATKGVFSPDALRKDYVEFMTTPGSHNDCYASTCHRMFFANRQRGLAPEKCPDNDHHNVDTIDGLIMAVPVVCASLATPAEEAAKQFNRCTDVTRNSDELHRYGAAFGSLLRKVLEGGDLCAAVEESQGGRKLDGLRSRADPVVA